MPPTRRSLSFRNAALGVLLSSLVSFGVAPASVARAQTANEIDSNVQGTVGLGLIGAELGLVVPAVFGMEGVWPYVVFPVALGGGGAVAGYFLIDDNNEVNAGVAMLAAGIALIIPAVVTTLALTAYDPDDERDATVEDAAKKRDFGDGEAAEAVELAPEGAPAEAGEAPAEATPPPEATPPVAPAPEEPAPGGAGAPPSAGFGLVRYAPNGAVHIGVPVVSLGTSVPAADVRRYGVAQQTELRVPLITGSF